MKIRTIIVMSTMALVLFSCSRPQPEIVREPAAPSGERLVDASLTNTAWYADRLEKLGFYVFPTPEPIPPFVVKNLSGQDVALSSLSGKVVLMNFWATWCPPCRTEMPSIQVLHKKLAGKAFEVMAISVAEKPSTVKDFLKSNPYDFPMYLDEDGSVSAPFAGRGIPTTFLLDKQGRAIAGFIGARSYDGAEIVALFTELSERLQ